MNKSFATITEVFEPTAGDHEVSVSCITELGTSKILQCDKTTGQLTFVIQVVNGSPGFARLKTPLP